MTVKTAVGTPTVPRPALPADPPVARAPEPRPPAGPVGRDRPLDREEREFMISMAVLVVVLSAIIVGGIVLSQTLWA